MIEDWIPRLARRESTLVGASPTRGRSQAAAGRRTRLGATIPQSLVAARGWPD